jgi:hypothetical protein
MEKPFPLTKKIFIGTKLMIPSSIHEGVFSTF